MISLSPSRRGAPKPKVYCGPRWFRGVVAGGILSVAPGSTWKRELEDFTRLRDGHSTKALSVTPGDSLIVAFGSEGVSGGWVVDGPAVTLEWVEPAPPDGPVVVCRGVARR